MLPDYLVEKNGELWLTDIEQADFKVSYRIKEIIYDEQSKFQRVMVLDSYNFGRMLILDGIVQSTSFDGHVYNEMITHVPISIHPNPKKVLIVGGGDCGAAKELCKYESIEQIDMVEIDEKVVEVSKKYLPEVSGNLSDPRVQFIFADGVDFIKNKTNEYDIIIVDSSDPIGPAEVLFEESFYKSINNALKNDGLMVCQSESLFMHSQITMRTYRYLSQIFDHVSVYTATVPTYPGSLWSFTIGSKIEIHPDPSRVSNKNTKYVNEKIVEQCFVLPQSIIKQM